MGNLNIFSTANAGDIIDYGVKLYKNNFKKLFLISLVAFLPFNLLISILYQSYISNIFNMMGLEASNYDEISQMFKFFGVIIIILLCYLVYGLTIKPIADASIISIVFNDLVYSKKILIKEAVNNNKKKFGKLLLSRVFFWVILSAFSFFVYFFFIIIVGILSLVIVGSTFSVFSVSSSASQATQIVLGIFLGLIFLVVFVFFILVISYFVGKFSLSIQAVAIEDKNGGDSISRCMRLGKKAFWRITFTYVFGALIVFLLPGTINYISVIVVTASQTPDLPILKILYIISQILVAFLEPILISITTVLFVSLKVRDEGYDIEIEFDNLIDEKKQDLQGEIYEY